MSNRAPFGMTNRVEQQGQSSMMPGASPLVEQGQDSRTTSIPQPPIASGDQNASDTTSSDPAPCERSDAKNEQTLPAKNGAEHQDGTAQEPEAAAFQQEGGHFRPGRSKNDKGIDIFQCD